MSFSLKEFTETLKLPARYLVAVAIASGIFLFLPSYILEYAHLKSAYDIFQPYLSIVFVLSISLLGVAAFVSIFKLLKIIWYTILGFIRLHHLTPAEQWILQCYICDNQRSNYFDLTSGDVNEFLRLNILKRNSTYAHAVMGLSYTISSWAWQYLKIFPKLLGARQDTRRNY